MTETLEPENPNFLALLNQLIGGELVSCKLALKFLRDQFLVLFPPIALLAAIFAPSSSAALTPASRDVEAAHKSGQQLIRDEKYPRALELYTDLVCAAPERTDLHRSYQNCLMVLDRKGEALRIYRRRLRQDPESPLNWYLLGRLLEGEQEYHCFTKAVQLDPDYPWGHYGLGWHWAKKEEYKRALEQLRRALELGLNEPLALYLGGRIYQEMGHYQNAIRTYRQYLRHPDSDPEHHPLLKHRVLLLGGDFSQLVLFIILSVLAAGGWFYYIRRASLPASLSWQNGLMLVVAGAVFCAYIVVHWLYDLMAPLSSELVGLHPLHYRLLRQFFVVGPVEEFAKWLFVLGLAYCTGLIDNPLDGMLCAASIAIGFALAENVFYMWWHGWDLIIARGIVCIPGHMVFSGLWGYGMGLSRVTRNRRKAWLGIFLSLAVGSFAHATYNATIEFEKWEDANELQLYAAWIFPIVFTLGIWLFRRNLHLARLWSPFFRRSQALKRQVAQTLDPTAVRKISAARPNTDLGWRAWSAAVNLVTQNVLERIRKTLSAKNRERWGQLLQDGKTKSGEILARTTEHLEIDALVHQECARFIEKGTAEKSSWKARRTLRKLRRQLKRELRIESMTHGPVRCLKG